MAKILIANPYEGVRRSLAEVLEADGHTFSLCPDGISVHKEIARSLPDLVITDVDLPDLDAFEMVRILQQATGDKGVPPVIVRSGLRDEVTGAYRQGDIFTWMGPSAGPEDLRALVRARLADAEKKHLYGKVLVVDDDLTIRRLLEKRLQMEGHEVVTALDGEEGLQRLAELPDLVLLDVAMPRLDGFGMLERMRADMQYQDIPVIVMTAHAQDAQEVARGLGLGANDYVRKPVEWAEFSARIQTQFRIREAHRLTVERQLDLAIIELAGAAAHEINNPLAVLMGRVEMILAQMDASGPFYKGLVQIDQLVQRIADVVQKMGEVRQYQVQKYCGSVNILNLDQTSAPDRPGG